MLNVQNLNSQITLKYSQENMVKISFKDTS